MELQNNSPNSLALPLIKRLLIRLLRTFFKLLYHQFAWTYDWVATIVSLGSWQRWVESVIPYIDGPRILEIGSGPGHLQLSLHQKGFEALGLEESHQMIGITQEKLLKSGLRPKLVRGQAQALPFLNEWFHQVVMTFPAEFVMMQSTIAEIYRVLVPGGRVIVLPVAWITGRKPLERAIAWLNRVTGEAPEWNERILDPLNRAGFISKWEIVYFASSKVLLITLIKPSP